MTDYTEIVIDSLSYDMRATLYCLCPYGSALSNKEVELVIDYEAFNRMRDALSMTITLFGEGGTWFRLFPQWTPFDCLGNWSFP